MPYPRARPAQGDRDGDASPPVNPAVTFDLFGTLVHLDERRLPRVRVDGVDTHLVDFSQQPPSYDPSQQVNVP